MFPKYFAYPSGKEHNEHMEGGGALKKTWIYLEGPSITLKADR